LAEHLESSGFPVVSVREPGGTALGERIREILLEESESSPMSAQAELMLFLAARAELVRLVIEPALREGKTVISDRYSDSTLAYQAFGRGLERKLVESANLAATGGLQPDLTILLDLDIAEGLKRVQVRNRFDSEDEAFHGRVRSGFLQIASDDAERVRIIDASRSKEEVAAEVRRIADGAILAGQGGGREK
jgi:dTMP kinase